HPSPACYSEHLPVFLLTICPPPTSTLFPYTTLFRSVAGVLPRDFEFPENSDISLLVALTEPSAQPAGAIFFYDVIARLKQGIRADRKSTRLNSSHVAISYAVFCLNTTRWATRRRAA